MGAFGCVSDPVGCVSDPVFGLAKPTDQAKLLCVKLCCAILQSLNGTVNDVPHLASIVPTCTEFFDEELQMFIGCFSALAQPPNSFGFALAMPAVVDHG